MKKQWLLAATLLALSGCGGNHPETCTVKFLNWDESYLGADIVKYGETAEYTGKTPLGPDTPKYNYTFKGWDASLENITSDCKRIAQFDKQIAQYNVRFINFDGSLLYSTEVDYDATAQYVGDTPTRPRDDRYEYAFTGWDVSLENIHSNLTATAQYQKTDRLYTVTFKNWDGNILSEQKGIKGSTLHYSGPTPTRPNDESGSFAFESWSPYFYGYISGDDVYTATFSHTLFTYTVTFQNWDKTLLGTQTVSWGGTASYNGVPTKESTVEHSYQFKGWDKPLNPIKANTTLIAQYSETIRQYDVYFLNYDGTVLETKKVDYGSKTNYSLATPVRPDDDFVYTFEGWDKDPDSTLVLKDTYFHATYSSTPNYAAFRFTLLEDGTYSISGIFNYSKTYSYAQLHVPESYKGVAVTAIDQNAFVSCRTLTTVVLPDSIKTIGDSAFSGCHYLINLTLSKNLVTIGSCSFKDTAISFLVLPNTVTSLGYSAFENCSKLEEATLSTGLQTLPASAFSTCSVLKKVDLGTKLASIGDSAFASCTKLTDIAFPDTLISIGASAFSHCGLLGQVNLPVHLASIGGSAFTYCTNWDPTDLPASLTSIGSSAFEYCSSLRKATIPSGITTLENRCFYACTSLREVTIGSGVVTIGQNVFSECSALAKLNFVTGSLLYLGLYCFQDCTSLSEAILPAGLTTIYSSAFAGCTSLTKVFIPLSVKSMSSNCFPSNYATKIYCQATAKPQYGWDDNWNNQCNNVYFFSETQPTTTGKFWHYVNDAITIW